MVLGIPNFSIYNWSILGCTNISDFYFDKLKREYLCQTSLEN